MQHTFLVEIGTEELPPKALRCLGESFSINFKYQLEQVKLKYNEIFWYASSRRLALKVINLVINQNNFKSEKYKSTVDKIFNIINKCTKSTKDIINNNVINIDQIKHSLTNKDIYLFNYETNEINLIQQALLISMVVNALNKLPIPKLMRWGDKEIQFVRPVHTLTIMLDEQILDAKVLGVQSSRLIRGHRFMGESKIIINSAEQYPSILYKQGKVIADYEKRKTLIKNQSHKIAHKLGGIVELPNSLLEEVTSLVEWPVVLTAKFNKKFLSIPIEALVYTIKNNQKYFPIYDIFGNLLPNFIFVANIESSDPQKIIYGNERVINQLLEDINFFFKMDCKKRLEEYLPQLKTILFQHKLGTLYDKTNRLEALSGWIANKINTNVNHVTRAALLSKCDLMTHMVFEFTNIQGIMGMHYAHMDGEAEDVALAIKEQYQPRFSGDKLPYNDVSAALALADKIDTIVGIAGINKLSKSNKDPYALRRAAFGILRIIIEKNYDLDLLLLIQKTFLLYNNKLSNQNVINDVIEFMLGRFKSLYKAQGYQIDTIQSVLARRPTKPADFDARIKAITYFRTLKVAKSLIASNKRVANILHKSNEKLNKNIIIEALKIPEEIILSSHLANLQNKLKPLFIKKQYKSALIELTSLNKVIDAFFNNVMVMDVDKIIRINRLTLLNKLRNLFLEIADISLLQ
ncbi:MAG: glycine--tRNA ligase subunit beta [Arsenophonus endosymbiont of Ceratovacuna japonica]